MGKHYRDPADKPVLGSGMCMTSDALIHTAVERNCSLYVMNKPPNRYMNDPEFFVFYLSREACVRNIATHNNGRINTVNNGNDRKARLLVYTADECKQYVLQCTNHTKEN